MSHVDEIPTRETTKPDVEPWPDLVRRFLFWLCWAIVSVLMLVALLRLVAWDDIQVFAWADALGLVLYLPAWVIGIAAAVKRKWLLLGASLLVVAAQLVFGLPELTAAESVPATAAHAFKIRVFDANVTYTNPSVAGYVPQVRAYRPDLLTMEEITPSDTAQLQAAGVFHSLPHTYQMPDTGSRGFVIASRYPLGPMSVSSTYSPEYGQLPFLVRTSIRLPGLTLPLWVVHTTAPVNPGWNLWNVELQRVDQLLEARHPGPLLVVGDFNATWGNRWFRAILGTGLTDGAAARGDPFDMTWSQDFFVLPPVIRIDHVLTNSSLAVTTISTATGPGSQHRELRATVAVLPSAYAGHRSATQALRRVAGAEPTGIARAGEPVRRSTVTNRGHRMEHHDERTHT
jgi:endonuclease/exonuclease/phosphatase (EEP) superfamily protein YafD